MTDMVAELSRPVDRTQLEQDIDDFNLTYPVNVDDALNAFTLPPVAGTGTAPATTTAPPTITTTAAPTRPTTSTRTRPTTTTTTSRPRPVTSTRTRPATTATTTTAPSRPSTSRRSAGAGTRTTTSTVTTPTGRPTIAAKQPRRRPRVPSPPSPDSSPPSEDEDGDDDDDDRLVVFHNLKGFDGMFILHELYQQQREVVDQLTVGAKVLSFRSGPIKFIDSLCFLPMPLASFPSTFNLTELKKGFFPHLFNTPDHQQYVGRIPDLEFYDPEGMMAKKKDELTRWHADQVRRNVPFHFKQEMIDYCKSDVALLKAGCEAFQQEFERQAGFNPMAKCITIASACNLYWRKHHLTPDTFAVEPLGGWRGAQVNQSLKALQWLYYQEHLIPKEGASADRIRHVRNGGEQSIRTSAHSHFVDGYDPLTRTVYEFHGCLYHGCPRCYPRRNATHYAVPDRSVEELYQATLSKRMALL